MHVSELSSPESETKTAHTLLYELIVVSCHSETLTHAAVMFVRLLIDLASVPTFVYREA